MFSLVISIIAIVLVVAIAAVTLYYGGINYQEQGSKAESIKFVTEAEQITGSIAAYKAESGSLPPDFEIADLKTAGYLLTIPPGEESGWEINGNYVINRLTDNQRNQNRCWQALKSQGYEFGAGVDVIAISSGRYLPTCANSNLDSRAVCCINEI